MNTIDRAANLAIDAALAIATAVYATVVHGHAVARMAALEVGATLTAWGRRHDAPPPAPHVDGPLAAYCACSRCLTWADAKGATVTPPVDADAALIEEAAQWCEREGIPVTATHVRQHGVIVIAPFRVDQMPEPLRSRVRAKFDYDEVPAWTAEDQRSLDEVMAKPIAEIDAELTAQGADVGAINDMAESLVQAMHDKADPGPLVREVADVYRSAGLDGIAYLVETEGLKHIAPMQRDTLEVRPDLAMRVDVYLGQRPAVDARGAT